jgi:hypothetical protein
MKNKRVIWAGLSIVCLMLNLGIIFYLPPGYSIFTPIFCIPITLIFFLSAFFFLFCLTTTIFQKIVQGLLTAITGTGYLLLFFFGLSNWFFLLLLFLLFIIIEVSILQGDR